MPLAAAPQQPGHFQALPPAGQLAACALARLSTCSDMLHYLCAVDGQGQQAVAMPWDEQQKGSARSKVCDRRVDCSILHRPVRQAAVHGVVTSKVVSHVVLHVSTSVRGHHNAVKPIPPDRMQGPGHLDRGKSSAFHPAPLYGGQYGMMGCILGSRPTCPNCANIRHCKSAAHRGAPLPTPR